MFDIESQLYHTINVENFIKKHDLKTDNCGELYYEKDRYILRMFEDLLVIRHKIKNLKNFLIKATYFMIFFTFSSISVIYYFT
jgi:hypothetical protein